MAEKEHVCLHERDWGSVSANIANMCEKIDATDEKVGRILEVLLGNGQEGLKTQVARGRTQTEIQWWFICVLMVAMVGAFVKSLF